MRLTPWEEERLLIFSAAELARRNRAAGILLNAPEAIALICDAMLHAARTGADYNVVFAVGYAVLSPDEVMPGVRELVDEIRLEVLLGDGTRLIVLQDPLGREAPPDPLGPGAIVAGPAPRAAATGAAVAPGAAKPPGANLERRTLTVTSTSRRAIRISSHFPFDRVNARLEFDRGAAAGFRLDLEAGSSERWAPGEARTVTLVRFSARRGDETSGDETSGAESRGTEA